MAKFKAGDVVEGRTETLTILFVGEMKYFAKDSFDNEFIVGIDDVDSDYTLKKNTVKLRMFAFKKNVAGEISWVKSQFYYKDDNDFASKNPDYPNFVAIACSEIEVEE